MKFKPDGGDSARVLLRRAQRDADRAKRAAARAARPSVELDPGARVTGIAKIDQMADRPIPIKE